MSSSDRKPFRGSSSEGAPRTDRTGGPRRDRNEGGFGRSERPRFQQEDRRSAGGDRPRFSNDRSGPRRDRDEGGFGRSERPRFNEDRGPRREGGERPHFNKERSFGDRPRHEEGGFGQSERPRFDKPRRDGDRPRFERDDRAPRGERKFGDRPRREEGGFGQSERPRFDKPRRDGDRPARKSGFGKGPRQDDQREQQFERSFEVREGETRRAFSGIRAYHAPAALKGKAAPVKIIRPEDKFGDKK